MTRRERGPAPSSAKDMGHTGPQASAPDNPWDLLLRNSVALDLQDKSLDGEYSLRLAGFQYLVYRYMIQVRYGCINELCTTPTCFSCVSRVSDKPLRRHTDITTRALAYHLATQDDPIAGLCEYVPSAWPELKAATEMRFHPGVRHPDIDPRSLTQNLFNTRIARTLNQPEEPDVHSKEWRDEKSAEYEAFHLRAGLCPCGCQRPLNEALAEEASQKEGGAENNVKEPSADTSPETSAPSKDERIVVNGTHNGKLTKPALMDHEKGRRSTLGDQGNNRRSLGLGDSDESTDTNGSVKSSNESIGELHKSSAPTPSPDSSSKGSAVHISVGSQSGSGSPSKVNNHDLPRRRSAKKKTLIASHLSCEIMDQLKRLGRANSEARVTKSTSMDPAHYLNENAYEHFSSQYVDQSIFHCLSSPEILLRSFVEKPTKDMRGSPLGHLDPSKMEHAFRSWQNINGPLIFDSLWIALESLFVPPPELKVRKSKKGRYAELYALDPKLPGRRNPNDCPRTEYIPDMDAAHIIMICIHALTSLVTKGRPQTWDEIRNLRIKGIMLPNTSNRERPNDAYSKPWLDTIDQLEYEPAVRLADRLARAIAARRCFAEIQQTTAKHDSKISFGSAMEIVIEHLVHVEKQRQKASSADGDNLKWKRETWGSWSVSGVFIEWLRTLIMKHWKGQLELKRWDTVGAAAEILADMYRFHTELGLRKRFFHVQHLREKVDTLELTTSYMDHKDDPNTFHLLQYPFLFQDHVLVYYFRTFSYSSMSKWYTTSGNNWSLQDRFSRQYLSNAWRHYLNEHYSVASSRYLKLDVRRSNVLEDTLDQLWGLEKRQLLLPLKVRIGVDEGERGVDQGGVAQEFFRAALAEAFNPDNGMFTVDPQNRMTWFQPFSLEPLSRFELIGLLFSIAVYNGITLPVTLPKAFYRRLLSKPVINVDQIRDGWPDLARSFDFLLSCEDEVGDILSREYEFSFEARGLVININMADLDHETPSPYTILDYTDTDDPFASVVNWPPEPSEAPLVTNTNRHQYVRDYISWLVDKSIKPQFDAFARGFRTCLPTKHLALLRPSLLRRTVEGSTHIDTHALERVTRYDGGFSAEHAFVRDFWTVVHAWDQERKRKLLEFVTASDRVPVAGIESVVFWVQRNGPDGEGLPTSSTCFGRLLLPEYKDREKLERKLGVAIENARGFGAA